MFDPRRRFPRDSIGVLLIVVVVFGCFLGCALLYTVIFGIANNVGYMR